MVSRLYKLIVLRNQLKVFYRLKAQINFTPEQKSNYQVAKLKEVLKSASTTEYYEPFLKNFDIDNLTYAAYCDLPFLTKDKIRESGTAMLNTKYKFIATAYENTSGGSTGEPVKFMRTKEQSDSGAGNYHLANYLNGVSPFSKVLIFWGAIRDMNNLGQKSFLRRLKNWLNNSEMFNTFVLSKEIISRYVERINSYRPQMIKAYVHSFYDISKYINENRIVMQNSPVIHTSTGPLYPEIKTEIQKAFPSSHVFSFYGSREVSAIATEVLNEEGMQVLYDNVFLEIINADGQPASIGEEGEIVITTLSNHYMPLIRYRIGDRAVKNDDLYTFGTLKIQSVLGRTLGVIHRSDGSAIDGQFFTTLFFKATGIERFQLVQRDINKLELFIVKGSNYKKEELTSILDTIENVLEPAKVQVLFTTSIDLTATGKIMYVYSEINQ